jgi:hypothetical protein
MRSSAILWAVQSTSLQSNLSGNRNADAAVRRVLVPLFPYYRYSTFLLAPSIQEWQCSYYGRCITFGATSNLSARSTLLSQGWSKLQIQWLHYPCGIMMIGLSDRLLLCRFGFHQWLSWFMPCSQERIDGLDGISHVSTFLVHLRLFKIFHYLLSMTFKLSFYLSLFIPRTGEEYGDIP